MASLRREWYETSASTADRILTRLKEHGPLVEPLWWSVTKRKGHRKRRWHAVRKPKGCEVDRLGVWCTEVQCTYDYSPRYRETLRHDNSRAAKINGV